MTDHLKHYRLDLNNPRELTPEEARRLDEAPIDYSDLPDLTMSEIDWSRCPDVESVPGRCGGQWVVKGTRVLVQGILDNAEDCTPEEIAGPDIFDLPLDVVRRILIYAGLLADYPPPADAPLVRCRSCGWVHVGIAAPHPWVGRDCFRCKASGFEVISGEEFRRTVPPGVTLQGLRWPPPR